MLSQSFLDAQREHCQAILVSLSAPHHDFVTGKIDVLDTKRQTLENPQPGTVQQHRHELRRSLHSRDQLLYFLRRQHHRQSDGPLGASDRIKLLQRRTKHLAVKKRNRRHSLVLCRSTDAVTDRESREELDYIILVELGWMTRSVEPDGADYPANVDSHGPVA